MKTHILKPKIFMKITTHLKTLVLVLACSCSTFTFNSCSKDGEKINIFSIEDDKTLGLQTKQQIEADPAQFPILPEAQYTVAYDGMHRIVNAILSSGQVKYKSEFPWEVKIIHKDSVLNAFCAPGGYIYIYTGLIKYLDSEDQLAGVMGHEMAHADRRHSTAQLTKQYGIETLISIITNQNAALLAQVAEQLTLLKYSRDDESEADQYSVKFLYPTEYDARGAARFFEKLQSTGQGSGTPVFLSTHPSDANRISDITKHWQDMGGKVGGTFADRYQLIKNSLPPQ